MCVYEHISVKIVESHKNTYFQVFYIRSISRTTKYLIICAADMLLIVGPDIFLNDKSGLCSSIGYHVDARKYSHADRHNT